MGNYLRGSKSWTNFFIVGKVKKGKGKKRIVVILQCIVLGFLWVFLYSKHDFGLVAWSLGAQAGDSGGQCARQGPRTELRLLQNLGWRAKPNNSSWPGMGRIYL